MASVLLSLGRSLARAAIGGTHQHQPLIPPALASFQPVRGIKHRHQVHKRCKHCYFEVIDEVKHVFCTKHPRHKQAERQTIPFRKRMILSGVSQGSANHGNGKGNHNMWTQQAMRMDF